MHVLKIFPKSTLRAGFVTLVLVLSTSVTHSQSNVHDPEKMGNVFGTTERVEGALIGIFYDLKQTQNREPTGVNNDQFPAVIDEFISSGWDEQALSDYYRVTRPVYATQIFIPYLNASRAPLAFGLEDLVEPVRWAVHYKGQVSPPRDGTYRFAGYGDDFLAVSVNEKTVLVSGFPRMTNGLKKTAWKSPVGAGEPFSNTRVIYGDWMELKADQPVDLDVLFGEHPGGRFCVYLLIEERGADYEKTDQGHPILPVFQLSTADLPEASPQLSPSHKPNPAPWRGWP